VYPGVIPGYTAKEVIVTRCQRHTKGKGNVKRVLSILVLTAVLAWSASGQLGRIRGEVRYEHRYSDYLYGNTLTALRVSNPVLDLRMSGKLGGGRIAMFNLYSSINAIYFTSSSPYYSYSSTQLNWNRYNLSLSMLPYAPVKLTLGARDNSNQVRPDDSDGRTETRNQEQRADLSIHQISWLPTVNTSFVRSRSFSVRGYPYDIVTRTLTASVSNATDTTGAYALTTAFVDVRDQESRAYDKYTVIEFTGQRTLEGGAVMEANAEYEQYTGYSTFGGGARYTAMVSSRTRTATHLSGTVEQSAFYQARSFSVGQSVVVRAHTNFVLGGGLSGYLSNVLGESYRTHYGNLGGNAFVQHQRLVGKSTLTNVVSGGYNEQKYAMRYSSLYANVSNDLLSPVGSFSFNLNYILSYSRVRQASSYDLIENSAGMTLSGTLPKAVSSQTALRYRDTRYPGDPTLARQTRSVAFTQRLNGSFKWRIPINVGATAGANWYFSLVRGRSYSWGLSFASPEFFLHNLTADYSYNRNFDAYMNGEVVTHRASFSYVWRAFTFQSRLRYATYPLRVREVIFTVRRRL
jgi:hypothetical protein